MATNTTLKPANSGSRLVSKVLHCIGRSTINSVKDRTWTCSGAAPSIDAGDHDSYPVRAGDVCLRTDSVAAYVCTVSPTASTAATFVQIG